MQYQSHAKSNEQQKSTILSNKYQVVNKSIQLFTSPQRIPSQNSPTRHRHQIKFISKPPSYAPESAATEFKKTNSRKYSEQIIQIKSLDLKAKRGNKIYGSTFYDQSPQPFHDIHSKKIIK